jgi:hypothetical protein
MREDSLKASVQYGDYHGTAAADMHDQSSLHELAEKYGVDTERYFVMGMQLYIGETRADRLGSVFVSILAVDKGGSFDSIQEYVNQNHKLPYVKFRIDASLDEVLLSFKRFEVVLSSNFTGVDEYRCE